MRYSIALILCVLSVALYGQHEDEVMVDSISSVYLDEVVEYKVYLPSSYESYSSSKTYPVVLILDRSNMFRITKSYVDFLAKTGKIPESILIGISSSNSIRDYTPTSSAFDYDGVETEAFKVSGGAGDYSDFLEQELIETITNSYRTNGFELLIGHSLSGLFGAHSAINSTSIDAFILIDPSTWWDDQVILGSMDTTETLVPNNRFVFLSSAGSLRYSDKMKRMKESQIEFFNGLTKIGFKEENLFFAKYEKDSHGSVPLRSILDGIEWIFSGYMVDEMKYRSSQDIISNFKIFDKRLNYHFPALEPMVTWLASVKRQEKKYEEALELLQMNIDNYPDSWKSYYDQGVIYQETSTLDKAIESYRMGLEQDPGNAIILKKLSELN